MADKKIELSPAFMRVVIVFLVGLFIYWGFRAYEIYWNAEGGLYPREVSVEAVGKAYVVPDTAKIHLGVYSNADSSEAVVKENTEKINKIMDVLKRLGIEKENIKTTNYNLYPNYQWTEDKGRYIDGYNLDQTVEVKLTDFDLIGDVMSKTVDAGANLIGDVSFVVDDLESAKTEARKDAIKKINEKVASIEEVSGLNLGRVLSYYEYESSNYGKGYVAEISGLDSYAKEGVSPLIEPGQREIELNVSLSYKVN